MTRNLCHGGMAHEDVEATSGLSRYNSTLALCVTHNLCHGGMAHEDVEATSGLSRYNSTLA